MKNPNDMKSVWLTAFFKWDPRGPEYGFERLHLQHIWPSRAEALSHISFCDEAGWYEGVLIEERPMGWTLDRGERVWFIQEGAELKTISEPAWFKCIVNLVG